jgi:5'-phosphate synthase pdxT subunit
VTGTPTIGVFALQGDVREHLQVLRSLGVHAIGVRRVSELEQCDGLVIPGGESTTMAKLARTFDLFEPIRQRIKEGLPVFGTCAGMIMLADRVEDGTADQASGRLLRGRPRLRRRRRPGARGLHPRAVGRDGR